MLHVLVAAAVLVAGRIGLFPGIIDRNGTFTLDSLTYRVDVDLLVWVLRTQGLREWFALTRDLHVKIYSLSYAVFGPVVGLNTLTLEPLNVLYYVGCLALVYKLASTIFDRRAGVIAAVVVGVWPSFLLISTQLVRDPLLNVFTLLLLLSLVGVLKERLNAKRGALVIGTAILAATTIWLVRAAMWDVVRVTSLAAMSLLFIHAIRNRSFWLVNTVALLTLLAVVIIIPRAIQGSEKRIQYSGQPFVGAQTLPLWQRIAATRQKSIEEARSTPSLNVGLQEQFHGLSDVLLYIPRAIFIGLFSPFPGTWFRQGFAVGFYGRVLAGIESPITYLIELLALVGIFRHRANLNVWLLLAWILIGLVGLGLVMVNVGSLYRFRYPFWITVVTLGAGGASYLAASREQRKAAKAL